MVFYNIKIQNEVKFEMKIGRENFKLSICENIFSISAVKKDLDV